MSNSQRKRKCHPTVEDRNSPDSVRATDGNDEEGVLINLKTVNLGGGFPLSKYMIVETDELYPDRKIRALHLADRLINRLAGPSTDRLEERYHKWQADGGMNDIHCLVCFNIETDFACKTCQRSFHHECIGKTFDHAETRFHCLLCIKRSWDENAPDSRSYTSRQDDIAMTLARKFLEDGDRFAEQLNMPDDGSLVRDHQLLQRLALEDRQPEPKLTYLDSWGKVSYGMSGRGERVMTVGSGWTRI